MSPRALLFVVSLAGLGACDRLRALSADTPSVPGVYMNIRRDGGAARLQLGSEGVEGDWTYGAFPTARLDGLVIVDGAGQAVEAGEPTWTPGPEGGVFHVPLAGLDEDSARVRVRGRFVGLRADGEIEVIVDFDREVMVGG